VYDYGFKRGDALPRKNEFFRRPVNIWTTALAFSMRFALTALSVGHVILQAFLRPYFFFSTSLIRTYRSDFSQ